MAKPERSWKDVVVEEVEGRDQNGRPVNVVNYGIPPEWDGEIRQGYRCPFDLQVFTSAFPERCPICALTPARQWFSPKQHQSLVYEQMSRGEQRYGPSDPDEGYDPELERWVPKGDSRILLPGKDF